MRILQYDISSRGIVNVAKAEEIEKQQDIIKRIQQIALTRIAKQIKDWQTATLVAELISDPKNYLLMAVYRDIEVDAHLFALMQTIILKVLANDFNIENEAGVVQDDLKKKFRKKWFRKFVIHTVNSKFYGYSLVNFGDKVNGIFNDCVLVKRDYVNQRKGVVQFTLGSSEGTDYKAAPWNMWCLGIGEDDDLGLLHKAAPLVIKKKEIISSWSTAAELFGMPMRIGRTNISSPMMRKNMEDMLEQMGSAAWGVFDKEDVIEFIQTTKTDFYQIYDKFIERINSELSKLILLQTGTTDEKSFTGSAQVHAGVLSDMIQSVILFVEEVVNESLMPLLVNHGIVPPGTQYKSSNEEKLSFDQQIAIITALLQVYDIPEEWIEETFEIPVQQKATPTPGPTPPVDLNKTPKEVMQQLVDLYAKFSKKKSAGK